MSEIDQVFVKDFEKLIKQRIAEKQRSLTPQNIVLKNIKNIAQARTAGMTWDEIADTLNLLIQKKSNSEKDCSISGNLVRFHYQKALETSTEADYTGLTPTKKRSKRKERSSSPDELALIHNSHNNDSGLVDTSSDALSPESDEVSGSSTTPKKSRFNFNTVRPEN